MASQVTDSEPSTSKKQTNIPVLSGKEALCHYVNMGDMILRTFKCIPNFIGQIDAATGEQTTFQQMRENSVKCALWLKKSVDSCKSVAVCTRNQTLAYIPFLASLYIGATIHPWEKTYVGTKHGLSIGFFVLVHQPNVIFMDSEDYDSLVQLLKTFIKFKAISYPKIITFDKLENVPSLEAILNDDYYDEHEIVKFSCEELAPTTIIATMFSLNAFNEYTANIHYFTLTCPANLEVPAMSPGDIGLWYGSLTWSYSIILIVRCILWNVTVIKPAAFTDEDMFKTIEKYKVTWVFLDSSMCNQMFETDLHKYNISSLKQFIYGDLPIRNRVCQSLLKYLTNVSIIYVNSVSEPGLITSYAQITSTNSELIPICGQLTRNVQIMIKDLNTKDVLGQNKRGEIWYRFVCECCKPEMCESTSCCNYQAKEDKINMKLYEFFSEWRCSEHFGYLKDDKLFVLDEIERIIQFIDKDLNKIFVSPRSIERVLNSHPDVSEVIVVNLPNFDYNEIPKAYVKIKDGSKVFPEELEDFVAENMPDSHKLRGGVKLVSEMPYLPNGKIDQSEIQYGRFSVYCY